MAAVPRASFTPGEDKAGGPGGQEPGSQLPKNGHSLSSSFLPLPVSLGKRGAAQGVQRLSVLYWWQVP